MRTITVILLLCAVASAQQTAAPTPEQAGSPRGETWGDYNVVDSIETGYRFAQVGGNLPQYRSSVNFGNGVRVLGSNFTMNSVDGHGRFFDEVVITTAGLGNDPYQSAAFRVQKNKLYRYDGSWRLNNYFNPGLTTDGASGQHFLNTQYQLQDHDLTLFPEGNFKFFAGYTGSLQTGPAYSSIQLFNNAGQISPLFSDLRRVRHEYRVGNEFRVFGIRVNWMRGWDNFKEDTESVLAVSGVPGIVNPATALTGYQQAAPYHGNSPYWRVALFADRRLFSMNGRFTYTSGQRGFVVDETATGPGRVGAEQNRQVVTYGDGQRPVATGNLTFTLLATSRLTLMNSASISNVRTSGNSYFEQLDNSTLSYQLLYFNYLGIRTFSDYLELNYQISPLFGTFAGYQYSNRRISSVEQFTISGTPSTVPAQQTNQLHSGRLGLRLRPMKPLTILLAAEVGRNDQPFTPVAERNYHALNGRLQYRVKTLYFTGGAETYYNVNSITLSSYSSQSRKYYASGAWNPREWLTLDAAFSRSHLYTIGGIAYFANLQLTHGDSSIYLSNINSAIVGARFALRSRADLYVGYTRVEDNGDGRATPFGPGIGSALPAFQAAQTFPMLFHAPMARFSVKITPKVRWNLGYQYYGYRENFYRSQGYRANTGYSSVAWSF